MIKKILKILLGIILLLSLVYAFVYIQQNKLLWFATGTKDKAILNATWKMSPQEINRANKTELVKNAENPVFIPFLFGPEVANQKSLKMLVQEDVFLLGHRTEIQYLFFDEMFYEYFFSLKTGDVEKTVAEITETLSQLFGKPTQGEALKSIYSYEWETPKQTLSLWAGEENDKKGYYVNIRAKYKPLIEEIDKIVEKEKKKYF